MDRVHAKDENLDFSILVGNTASWPLTSPTTNFNIPDDLLKTYERFNLFYQNQYSGRMLTWLFALSKADLKANYLKSGYIFQVSTLQMSLLLQFNTAELYSHQELQTSTALNEETLQGCLGILLRAKVLLLETKASAKTQEQKYKLNFDFKSKKIRVNLNLPLKSDQKADVEQTQRVIEEDRSYLIQVCFFHFKQQSLIFEGRNCAGDED